MLSAHTGGIWDFERKDHTRFWTSMGVRCASVSACVFFFAFVMIVEGRVSTFAPFLFSSIPSSVVVEFEFVWWWW